MSSATQRDSQGLFPFLYVDEVGAYLDFLVHAFGFQRRNHFIEPDDHEHQHAEVAVGGEILMIGKASPRWGTTAPRTERHQAGVYVRVDDADAHCQMARAAGAIIEAEPEDKDWGDRIYMARDPEGHQWYFAAQKKT